MDISRRNFLGLAIAAAVGAVLPKTKTVEVVPAESESKKWEQIGQDMMDGYAQGIDTAIRTTTMPSIFLEREDGTVVVDCEPWTAVSTWEPKCMPGNCPAYDDAGVICYECNEYAVLNVHARAEAINET